MMQYAKKSFVRVLGFLSFLVLLSCDPYKGTIQIFKGIEWYDDDEVVYIPAGNYNAELEFKSENRVELDVKIDGGEDDIRLYIPDDVDFPEYNGDIYLSSEDSGQPWDVQGEVKTRVRDSRQHSGTQQCSHRVRERVCEWRDGRRRCWYEYVTRYGYQEIDYHYKYTNSNVSLNLVDPRSQAKLANFRGTRSSSETIVTHRGRCY